jgi:hypothetical protein
VEVAFAVFAACGQPCEEGDQRRIHSSCAASGGTRFREP